jgi:hypothetical protein
MSYEGAKRGGSPQTFSEFKKQQNEGVEEVECGPSRPNQESYCTMAVSNILAPELSQFTIKNPRLQHIYNEERDDLEKSFADIKKVYDPMLFKYEALIAFWLALH